MRRSKRVPCRAKRVGHAAAAAARAARYSAESLERRLLLTTVIASPEPALYESGDFGPAYVANNDGWDGPGNGSAALTYWFRNYTADIPQVEQRAAVTAAMAEWSRFAFITWAEAAGPDQDRSIDIAFASIDGTSNAQNVLAVAWSPPPTHPEPTAGNITFDDDETWSTDGSAIDLFSVALHELGHALGLGHSDDPRAVMYRYYSEVTHLASDDIAGIQSIYAPFPLGQTDLDPDLAGDGAATVAGTLSGTGARDLFTFTGRAGDLLTVTVDTNLLVDPLDTALVVFAPGQRPKYIVSETDTGSFLRYSFETKIPWVNNPDDPETIQVLLTEDGTYTIQVQVDPHASGGDLAGPYTLDISLQHIPATGQAFWLDFSEFDPSDVSAYFGYLGGDPAAVRQTIVDAALNRFRNIFSAYNIMGTTYAPPGGSSRLRFVDNVNPAYIGYLGVADQVDVGNRDHSDGARIFFDHFGKGGYRFSTAEAVGLALGTVAAHEAGHLLGLHHVSANMADEDLMGNLADYVFLLVSPVGLGTYTLYEAPNSFFGIDVDNYFDVFGKQDSAAVLLTTLGPAQAAPTGVRVIYTDPVQGGPMVARNANIRIQFSEPMNAQSLGPANVRVAGSVSGVHDGLYTYSAEILTIDPFVDFSASETVTITVSRDVQALSGSRMASDHVFTFQTVGATPTAIQAGGTLANTTVWTTGNVYVITSDLTVPAGVSLIIQPGVVVKFDARDSTSYNSSSFYRKMHIYGTLDLRSTASQKIVFTSSRDDTYGGDSNGDGAATSPATYNWGYIRYYNPANVLHDAVVRYGGWAYTDVATLIWASGSAIGALEIRDSVIEYAYGAAVYGEPNQTPHIHGNTIRNSNMGIWLEGTGTVQANTISNNRWGIRLDGGTSPIVANNTISNNEYTIYQGVSDPVYSGNVFSGNTNTAIAVGGSLTRDMVWEDVQGLGMPYLVLDDVTVPAGRTLSIDPGVVVKFDARDSTSYSSSSYRKLHIYGTLDLRSTASRKIVFTSSRDDTYGGDSNGDGAATSPANYNWGYIRYYNPANVLHDAVVRYGGGAYYNDSDTLRNMIWVSGSGVGTLEIRDSVIERANRHAIYVDGNQAPNIRSSIIRSNLYGVYLATSGTPTIESNTFTGNTYPIYQGSGDAIYSGNVFSGNTNTAIAVGGSLTQDVVWEDVQGLGMPYLVVSDVTVPAGRTLSIDAGVVVKFGSTRRLTVQGSLFTNGTSPPSVFTSYRDDSYGGDSNGDGSSQGSPGDWAGIYFQTTANVFDHAFVRYAGLNMSGPTIAIRQVSFDRTPDPAIRITSGSAGTTVRQVNFLNASGYGIRNDTGNVIDARDNYWGHPSGPGGVGPGSGAGVSGNVTYSPWLTVPASMMATAPVITSTPSLTAVALAPYRYDADGLPSATGTGTFVWAKLLGPNDLTVNATTGEISWLPLSPGDYVIGIAVSDDVGSTSQFWQVRVSTSGDSRPPKVIGYAHHVADQGNGLVRATITATFGEGVQVRPIDVALLNSLGQTMALDNIGYEPALHRLTVIAGNLQPATSYTFRLMDTITDDAGNRLDGEFDGYTFPSGNGVAGGVFSLAVQPNLIAGTAGDDVIYVRMDPVNDSTVQVFHNVPMTGAPTHTLPVGSLPYVIIDGRGGNDTLTILGTLSCAWTFNGGSGHNTLHLDGTSIAVGTDLGASTDALIVNLTNGAGVVFNASQHLAGLSIADGTGVTIAPGGDKVLVTESLSITGTGRLNLKDNDLVVGAASLPAVQAMIRSGYNNGAWNGPGITSDLLGTDKALGYAAGNDPAIAHLGGQLNGQPFGPGSVIVKYTYGADGNLDGQVDVVDLGILATHWQGEGRTWTSADFNYSPDGKVDVVDLGILATNWQKGVGSPLGLPLDVSALGLAGAGDALEPVPPAPQVRIAADRKTGVLTSGIGAVDFGTVLVSSQKRGPQRTFRVSNNGDGVLALRLHKLPRGFTLLEPLERTLRPGESDTFTVRMSRTTAASHARALIRIDTNDPTQARFDIPITGIVLAGSPRAARSGAPAEARPAPSIALAPIFSAAGAIAPQDTDLLHRPPVLLR